MVATPVPRTAGKVYLVGAGPGNPELITVRGLRCLQRADVLVYDRLVHPELVAEAPATAEKVYVGKAVGRQALPQAGIGSLLVAQARLGRRVVRLKGGDPMVFGRGGEEIEQLDAAGIPWELVPAVSSAIGVPGRAGIPITYRGVAASFAVVTAHRVGHEASTSGPSGIDEPDWAALARIDTLVVLMGVGRLPWVCAELQRQGRAATTPAALIERGTLADERQLFGTLGDLAERAARAGIRPPATLVVGEVVALRRQPSLQPWHGLSSFSTSPHGASHPDALPNPLGESADVS